MPWFAVAYDDGIISKYNSNTNPDHYYAYNIDTVNNSVKTWKDNTQEDIGFSTSVTYYLSGMV